MLEPRRDPRCVVKRNGHDRGGLPRAKYLTGSSPANDTAPTITLTAEELVALVGAAVNLALDERDAREGGVLR